MVICKKFDMKSVGDGQKHHVVLFSIILILIKKRMYSLPALCLRGEFCDLLLVNAADLPGPLGALGVGGVA